MNIRKGLTLFFILLFPSLLYIFLTSGKHNVLELPYYGRHDSLWTSVDGKRALDSVIHHQVADFAFLDQAGNTVTRQSVDGKIYVADFFFTTCQSICPVMSGELYNVQEAFKNDADVMILSHTVDPDKDTVEAMAAYAEQYHADAKQWLFLTGSKKELYDRARDSYLLPVAPGDGGEHDFIHAQEVVLIDKQGHIRGMYDGTSHKAIKELIQDIRKLKADEAVPKKKH